MKNRANGKYTAYAKGFTLIELLVVIALIAVIAAMLFPVFARVRESGRKVACLSNLKQIGAAVQMYSQDYDDTLPNTGAAIEGQDLTHSLGPYIKHRSRQGIWKCPSHSFNPDMMTSSYGYNWQYLLSPGAWPDVYPHVDSGVAFGNSGVSVAFLAHPADTVCFIEHTAPQGNEELWTYVNRAEEDQITEIENGFGRPHFRHNGQANVLFCDGHVKAFGPAIAQAINEKTYWDPR
jgi:prepilin-type processing-associated H-X9-DG protein/prepilin-type N-terminal cleavage/methylation domain-containing protein